ncbi:MAG: chemotaxis-specific protein-glutamate methyltransferase CheB [Chitinispirillaceae bacterium]
MHQIRVFVVDDSVVFRKLLLKAINSVPGVRTVGVASNGKEAIEAIPSVKPDFITLDLNMPVMNGLETLNQLRRVYPSFKVLMVSAYTSEGAQATLQALEAGALDFITKPEANNESQNSRILCEQLSLLFSKYADSQRKNIRFKPELKTAAVSTSEPRISGDSHLPLSVKPEVVALGISTGGPRALAALLPLLPSDFPFPLLIVQHMPKLFTKTLAESLDRKTHLRVVEAQNGEEVNAGKVFIAPGGKQMKVVRNGNGKNVLKITDDPPENHCKPSVDYLFRSVAQVYGANAMGIIMTGMGSDGVLGLKLMKRKGARVMAQNRESCAVWGMPRMAIEAGVVEVVLSPEKIAAELLRCGEI